jgi:hypothetical protein
MESIATNRRAWLGLVGIALVLVAASRLTSGPAGPICTVQPDQQPGFTGLAVGTNPACIRIELR